MANLGIRVTQALLTRHANRFALDKIYVIAYTDEGLEIGIVHPDDSKERQIITPGETVTLGGEKWLVETLIPSITILSKGEVSDAPPRAIAQLATNI